MCVNEFINTPTCVEMKISNNVFLRKNCVILRLSSFQSYLLFPITSNISTSFLPFLSLYFLYCFISSIMQVFFLIHFFFKEVKKLWADWTQAKMITFFQNLTAFLISRIWSNNTLISHFCQICCHLARNT